MYLVTGCFRGITFTIILIKRLELMESGVDMNDDIRVLTVL